MRAASARITLNPNKTALALMLGFVLSQSFLPSFIVFGDARDSPLTLSAGLAAGTAAGCFLALAIFFRSDLFSQETRTAFRAHSFKIPMFLWAGGFSQLALLAWSTHFIDVSATASLFETWPLILVAFTGWLFRRDKQYPGVSAKSLTMFGAGAAGAALIIASQTNGFGGFADADLQSLTAGVSLALGASALAGFSGYGFRWTANFSQSLRKTSSLSNFRLETFSVLAGVCFCSALATPLQIAFGLLLKEEMTFYVLAYGFMGGVFFGAVAAVMWRMAVFTASRLEIMALVYLTPAFALVWLFAFDMVGDVELGYLLAGLSLIIAANAGVYLIERVASRHG